MRMVVFIFTKKEKNMKKYMKALCMAGMLCTVALPTHAIDWNWGLKGGMDFTGSSYKGLISDIQVNDNQGFFIGPTAELCLPIGFSVDASVLYLQRKTRFGYEIDNSSIDYLRRSIDIPLYAKFTFAPFKLFGIFAGVGPSFTFDIKNDDLGKKLYTLIGQGDNTPDKDLFDQKKQASLNFMVGIMLFKHLRASINYRTPLGSVTKTSKEGWETILTDDFSSKDRMWQFVVSLTF